jgi:hypothetical protein
MANETNDQIKQLLLNDKNITLTDNEIKIVMIKYIIHGISPFYDAPIQLRAKLLQVAIKQAGFTDTDDELQNLGLEILKVQEWVNNNAMKFLNDNKEIYRIIMRDLKDGNDKLVKVVDKTLEGGLNKLLRLNKI